MNEIKQQFTDRLSRAINENTFVKLTFGKYRGSERELGNIYISPVKIKDDLKYSFRYRYKTQDVYKNYGKDETISIVEEELGKNFLHCALFTTANDIIIEYNKRREPRLYTKKPSFTKVEIKQHNRIKTRYIDSKEKYLYLLGITNAKGEVKGERYDKFRQIDKFVEIIDSLYSGSNLTDKNEISIVDFGSGKSYLTFAMYDYFTNSAQIKANIMGVEQRESLVSYSNSAAEQSGFKNLSFTAGDIASFTVGKADIVTALHACDTATDDAIAKAVKLHAEVIILAPCCHKYVRKRIEMSSDLSPVFKHGILEEHMAAFITDGLRALLLESFGYKTKIFEFVSAEHTDKNIMITALKDKSKNDRIAKITEIEKLKSKFGLKDFYLDKLLS